jgi:CDP-diacylglycerol--glycerol-3-phosphate 3-phosphatidyltransferase
MLTIIGLLLSIVTALVIAQGYLFAGGLLVLFAGIFDMFDGAMARALNAATTFGAFLDSTLDRYSEGIILFGLLYYAIQRPGLQDALWPTHNEQAWMIAFIFIAVVGSLMVSYARARAEGLDLECKNGLLARPERVVILAIGLLTHTDIWAVAILAVLSNVTAFERIFSVWRTTQNQLPPSTEQASQSRYHTSFTRRHRPTKVGSNEAKESNVQPMPTSIPPFGGGKSLLNSKRHSTTKTTIHNYDRTGP